jgi:hypothetical protein
MHLTFNIDLMIYLILIELEQPSPIKFNKKFIVMVVCALSALKKQF